VSQRGRAGSAGPRERGLMLLRATARRVGLAAAVWHTERAANPIAAQAQGNATYEARNERADAVSSR
jgi:hypothetical protein